jgi:tripartite-type tricarboxylate transporter receptor subunit TctC
MFIQLEIILNILQNFLLTFFLLLTTNNSWANTNNWPQQPISIIVGYTPGGASDQQARIIAQALGERLKVPVVVKNIPGGNNIPAVQAVLKGDPDYTFMLADSGAVTGPASIDQHDYQNIQPVMIWATSANVVFRNPKTDPDEFLRLVKNNQPVQISTPPLSLPAPKWAGSIKPLIAELIPYKGGAESIASVVAGHVPYGVNSLATSWNWIEQKSIIPIMVSSDQRVSSLPNVPTFRELGFVGESDRNWWGLVVPTKTNANIISKLHKNLIDIVSENQKLREFDARGVAINTRTQKESQALFDSTVKKAIDQLK